MKYLRWITGHPILSLLLITVVYGLLNLSNLHHWLGQEDSSSAAEVAAEHGAAAPVANGEAAPAAVVAEVVVEKKIQVPAEAPAAVAEVVEVEKTVTVHAVPAVVETPVAEASVSEAPAAAAPAPETAPAEKSSGGLFSKLFTGKAPAQVADTAANTAPAAETATAPAPAAETAITTEATTAAEAGSSEAVKEEKGKGSSVLGFFKKEESAEATPEAAAPEAKEERGSLFGFFKRKQPEQAETKEAAKAEGKAAPADETATKSAETTSAPVAAESASAPAAAETASAPAAAETVSASGDAKTTEATIIAARKAFWNRDFAGATKMYEALIAKDPENPDLYGEFGNMLIQSGKLPQGLESYEKAADLLIVQRRYNEVGSLIRFIGNYDRSKAMALVEKMPGH